VQLKLGFPEKRLNINVVPNWGLKLGSQIGVSNWDPYIGVQNGGPYWGLKLGSQIGVPNWLHMWSLYCGSLLGVHIGGPYWGFILGVHIGGSYWGSILRVHIGVPNRGPK
jgi:hypothetical protein